MDLVRRVREADPIADEPLFMPPNALRRFGPLATPAKVSSTCPIPKKKPGCHLATGFCFSVSRNAQAFFSGLAASTAFLTGSALA